MQPRSVCDEPLQGSLVTPKSTLLPSLPDCGAPDSLARQPVTVMANASGTASAATMRLFMRRLPFLTESIGERPCLPVVAYANPYSEQASRFKEQENND